MRLRIELMKSQTVIGAPWNRDRPESAILGN
jgi:hypothetical protein